jgi:hypothetical protein
MAPIVDQDISCHSQDLVPRASSPYLAGPEAQLEQEAVLHILNQQREFASRRSQQLTNPPRFPQLHDPVSQLLEGVEVEIRRPSVHQ